MEPKWGGVPGWKRCFCLPSDRYPLFKLRLEAFGRREAREREARGSRVLSTFLHSYSFLRVDGKGTGRPRTRIRPDPFDIRKTKPKGKPRAWIRASWID